MRARPTRARKSQTLLSSIDLSIDDRGWKGGSSFLHRLLFLLEMHKSSVFFVSRKSTMADERKDAFGKERTKGVRVHRGVLTRAGEFLPFFFSLFSLSSLYFFMEEEVNDDVVWKERLWERFQPFNFLKRSLVPREFDSLKSESSSFFFRFFFSCERRKSKQISARRRRILTLHCII